MDLIFEIVNSWPSRSTWLRPRPSKKCSFFSYLRFFFLSSLFFSYLRFFLEVATFALNTQAGRFVLLLLLLLLLGHQYLFYAKICYLQMWSISVLELKRYKSRYLSYLIIKKLKKNDHSNYFSKFEGKFFFMKKQVFKILAKTNKLILPSFTKKRLDISKASVLQLAIIGWRAYVTKNSLD